MEDINNMTYLSCVIKVSDCDSVSEKCPKFFLKVGDFKNL